jgi:hypothetical protein
MATLIPTIKWSQNDDYVIINLEINQVKNDVYEINNNNIVFTGVCNTNLKYSIDLELLDTINKDESKYIVEERVIRFVLKKTEYKKWIRLTKDKNQYKSNIKVNWDSFEDSDEEEQEDPQSGNPSNQQFDFSNMMNMGAGDNNGFNMEEMMKNMDPEEMAQLMKSMNIGGNDDDNEDDNEDDNDDDNDDDNNEYDDKDLEGELDNLINDDDNDSVDSDDLCQDCVIP